MVNTQQPPSLRMPRNSPTQISFTSLVVEIFFSHEEPSNQKCAASSSVHWIGSSTIEVPSCRYGTRSSMKFDEYRNPCCWSRSSVLALKSHAGDRYPTTSSVNSRRIDRPFVSSSSSWSRVISVGDECV